MLDREAAAMMMAPWRAIPLLRTWRARIRRQCDVTALNAVAPIACHAANLRAAFTPLADDLGAEWAAVEARVAPLQLEDRIAAVNPGDRRAIYELVRQLRPATVLEVGTWIGGSTTMLALALEKNGGGRITTVDIEDVNRPGGPWKQAGLACSPRAGLALLGLGPVTFEHSSSLAFLGGTPERYDFVFLDGAHEADVVYQEIAAASKLLNPGGVIALHDYFPGERPLWADGVVIPGPWLAVQRLIREGARLGVTPLGRLRWPTKQGSNMTSLAVITAPVPTTETAGR
jgi:predicted O-methyltransferase YrrM